MRRGSHPDVGLETGRHNRRILFGSARAVRCCRPLYARPGAPPPGVMSIIRACLRLATVAALRDRTWAETRVYNSNNAPLAAALESATAPYIVVYTDDDARDGVEGLDLFGSDRFINLSIAFAVAGPVKAVEGGSSIDFPATDAGYEMVLDLIESQIIAALVHDPQSTWGEIWRQLATHIGAEARSRRGASAEGGV